VKHAGRRRSGRQSALCDDAHPHRKEEEAKAKLQFERESMMCRKQMSPESHEPQKGKKVQS
jgi:hypothetical protein